MIKMSTTYPLSTRKKYLGKAPIKKVELSTSIQIDPALTDRIRTKRSKLESLFEGSRKSSQAAGAIEEVAVIMSEMTRVEVR